jgi:hypothetical protein
MLFPVFHVFRILLKHRNSKVIRCISSHPLLTDGFAITSGKKGLVFLANMSEKKQNLQLKGIHALGTLFSMHERNFEDFSLTYAFNCADKEHERFTSPFEIKLMPFETRILEYAR